MATPDDQTRQRARRFAADNSILDFRAVVYGLIAFALLAGGGVVWKFASTPQTFTKIKEFEFSVEEPKPERFELGHPQRDLIRERPERAAVVFGKAETAERPNIQVAIHPREDVRIAEETVQTENIKVEVPEINIRGKEIEIDAPVEISEVSDRVQYALTPITATVVGPGELFKYKEPNPPDKPLLYTVNSAPRAARTMHVMPQAFGRQDVPAIGKPGPINVNLFGTGDYFRTMTRVGDAASRSAVDSALHWLAVHQGANGMWSADKPQAVIATEGSAVTGLSLLAFMGGGNTISKGEYRRNVLRGLEALIQRQSADGPFDKNMYAHAICTIALCEAYGRARDERLGGAARKGIAHIEKAVNPDGGWRYTPNCGTSDMSVTSWQIQALKTAKIAQIKFDEAIYSQALSYVDSVTDQGAGLPAAGGCPPWRG